jgi:cyanophycinase-like exopeptidase
MQFISLLNEEERFCWLQQDGATSHTAILTMEMIKQFFDERMISRKLATAISRPNTPRLLSLGLSESSCLLKSPSNY